MLFGTTPAPTVTYISDTQITAVVPAGSGTVNVVVQSGTNETDNVSDNPDANVNAPIFGYGTSAVTTADKFSFSAGLPGDANQDGIVNAQDIALVSANWLTHGPVGDLNSDGIVNAQDLALITANWLATTGSTANAISAAGAKTSINLAAAADDQPADETAERPSASVTVTPGSDLVAASSVSHAGLGRRSR